MGEGLLVNLLLLMPCVSREVWENCGGSFQPGTERIYNLTIHSGYRPHAAIYRRGANSV